MTRSSMIGCSAAWLVETAPDLRSKETAARWRRAHAKPARTHSVAPARAADGIPAGMCPRCGYPGPHANAVLCIDALRAELARFE